MIRNPITAAIALAAHVHASQRDKADEEYLLHPLEVWRMVRKDHGLEAQIVAILHDVLEDFKGSMTEKLRLEQQIEDEFGSRVFKALLALSHRKGENYDDYIERVALNYLARIVKISDLTHNMDPRRIPAYQIVDKDFQRWDKYRRALIRLEREDA
jgi:(p)ppGpp synthase/HD superfamily hydrolase